MVSDIVITEFAESQLAECVRYLAVDKMSTQAASALTSDARATMRELKTVADSLAYCSDEDLGSLGYKKILFKRHNYLFLFRVIEDVAYKDIGK